MLADQLGAQVGQDDVVGEVESGGLLARQAQREEAAIGVELLELGVGERDDLREKRVDTHERRECGAQRLARVVVGQRGVALDRRVQ